MQLFKKGHSVTSRKPKDPHNEFHVVEEEDTNLNKVKKFIKELAMDSDSISNSKNQLGFFLHDKFGDSFNTCINSDNAMTVFYIWVLPYGTVPFAHDIFYCRRSLTLDEIEYTIKVMDLIGVYIYHRKLHQTTPIVDSIQLVV